MSLPLIILLVLLLCSGGYGLNAGWGVFPVGGIGLVILIFLILLLVGRI